MDNTLEEIQKVDNLRQDLQDHREEIQRLLGEMDDIATNRNVLRAILEKLLAAHSHGCRCLVCDVARDVLRGE